MTTPARKTAADKAAAEPDEYTTTVTIFEMMDQMTGYDELAIEQELGRPFEVLGGADKSRPGNEYLLTRALVACHRRHEGDSHVKAWKYAMEMSSKDLKRYFTPEGKHDNDVMTPELVSESGKGAA